MRTPAASRSTIAGTRAWDNRDPLYRIPYGLPAGLLQVAELGPEVGVAEHVRLLAAQHAKHLGGDLHRRATGRLLGDAGDVRAHDDVVELEQAAVGGDGLLLEDVDARRSDLAALEGHAQRLLVLHLAARGVDEDHARLHLRDRFGIDHMVGLGRVGRVAGHDVGLPEDRDYVGHGLDAAVPELVVGDVLVVADHAHAERAGRLGHSPPDIADADDPER